MNRKETIISDQYIDFLPAAGDCGDLGEGQFKQHLFLVVDHVHAGPVDCNDHVVLWQARAGELVRLVESREEQRPLVLGVVHNVLFHLGTKM